MAQVSLTPNACEMMLLNETQGDLTSWGPRVQVISIKPLPSTGASNTERNRFILSDGTHYVQAMLNTQLNYVLEQKIIEKNSTFVITKIANNFVQNKRLIIILEVDVSSVIAVADRIGDPKGLDPTAKDAPTTAAAAANVRSFTAPAPAPAPPHQATLTKQQSLQRPSNGGERPPTVIPIEGLSPYQNKWTIRALVTSKSEIKTWSNARGDGKLFGCTFVDETGEIKATAFNAACDELFDKVIEGKVYYVSRARVNVSKKKYGNVQNDYEITLERTSEIMECHDTINTPQVKYNFVRLDQMENLQKDSTCDVLAVVHELGPLGEIISKSTSKPVTKRELTLVDQSQMTIRMTLWGKTAESFTSEDHPVISVKGAKVGDYGGRNLSMFSGSSHQLDPDLPESHALRGWYDSTSSGSSSSFRAQAGGSGAGPGGAGGFRRDEVKTLEVVQETLLGLGDKPDYFNSRVRIVHVKQENISYTACPAAGCSKKVLEGDDGAWRCEKCGKSYPECEYRYLLSVSCADHTGQIWLQGFNEVGELLLGISAKDLHTIYENDQDAFTAKINAAVGYQWNLSCRVKQETYNEQTRPRYGINRAYVPNYAEEGLALIKEIEAYPASVSIPV